MPKEKSYHAYVEQDAFNPELDPNKIRDVVVREAYRTAARLHKDILPRDECGFHITHDPGSTYYKVTVYWEVQTTEEKAGGKQSDVTKKQRIATTSTSGSVSCSSDQISVVPPTRIKRPIVLDEHAEEQ